MNCNVIEQGTPFTLAGRTYDLRLTFWVEAALYERFGGGVERALTGPAVLKNVLAILTLLLNEAVGFHNESCPDDPWPELDERYVGRHLTSDGAAALIEVIHTVFYRSRPEGAELTDEEKNGSPSR